MDFNNLSEEDLFDLYWQFQAKQEEHKKKEAAAKAAKEQVLDILASMYPQDQVQSHQHKKGTFHYTTNTKVNVSDFDAFIKFVVDNNRYDMLQRAAKITPVADYVEEHAALVPGTSLYTETKPRMRKPTNKGD